MAYPNDSAQVNINYILANGGPATNVLHIRKQDNSDFDSADAQAAAVEFANWVQTPDFFGINLALISHLSVEVVVTDVVVTGLERPATPQGSVTLNVAGLGAGDPLQNEAAFVTTWRTGFLGRSYRGRSYFPQPRSAILDTDGTIEPTVLASIQTTMAALVQGLLSNGNVELVVHSRLLGVVTPVVSAVARDTLHHISNRNG